MCVDGSFHVRHVAIADFHGVHIEDFVEFVGSRESKNVKINVGRRFLNLIDKHFQRTSKLHKTFNMNIVKVSYSCMPNMKAAIEHTQHPYILSKTKPTDVPIQNKCNCRRKEECPIPENCLATNVIYKDKVTTTERRNKTVSVQKPYQIFARETLK